MKKISKVIIVGCLLMLCISSTVLAASAKFETELPAFQNDVEVSTVRKESTNSRFIVSITSIGAGTDKVCAWTENYDFGYNYSSPYVQVYATLTNLKYDTVPSVGTNVSLNLDNPVKMETKVAVEGAWTPN